MKAKRLNLALMATLPLFACFFIVALSTGTENYTEKSSDPVGQAFHELFENSVREERLLPIVENGQVKAVEPRSEKLLQYLIDDYRSRGLEQARAIHYYAVAGLTSILQTANGVGQFKASQKPTASYFLTIGSEIAAAEVAIILIAIEESDGIHETKSVVYWNKQSKKWSLLRSEGPSPSPVAVQALP
jgi:hypothetical protein